MTKHTTPFTLLAKITRGTIKSRINQLQQETKIPTTSLQKHRRALTTSIPHRIFLPLPRHRSSSNSSPSPDSIINFARKPGVRGAPRTAQGHLNSQRTRAESLRRSRGYGSGRGGEAPNQIPTITGSPLLVCLLGAKTGSFYSRTGAAAPPPAPPPRPWPTFLRNRRKPKLHY